VIGGGPAGATCARKAAEAGLDVLLLEKANHPRDKPCGGALGPFAVQNLDLDISPMIEHTFHGALVHTPSQKKVILTSKNLTGHLITRSRFDSYLLQKAVDEGVEVIQGVEVVGLEQLRSGIRALAVGDSYKSHLLVGADGVNSIIARKLGVRPKWASDQVAMCISAEVPLNTKDVESVMMTHGAEGCPVIELYFDLVSWGYGWCFPKEKGLSVGVGCRLDKREDLRHAWEKLVTKIELDKGIELDTSRKVSSRVPLGGKIHRSIARRSMLIGDAAGLVSPITGEGISYAIQSGSLAAKIASEAVEMKTPTHVVEYDTQLKKKLEKELIDSRWIADILHRSPKHSELLFQMVDEDPVMRNYFTDVLSRVVPFSNMKGKIGKRMLSKHPLKALQLGLR